VNGGASQRPMVEAEGRADAALRPCHPGTAFPSVLILAVAASPYQLVASTPERPDPCTSRYRSALAGSPDTSRRRKITFVLSW